MRQRVNADDLTIYRKKQIDVSFLCVCPVIDNVKVVCGFTRLLPRGSTATLTML